MTVTKEYWNIPKPDDVLSVAQGTNLTVFVDHADNALFWGFGASDVTAMTGVFIAVCALVVSIIQARSTIEVSRISVRPHLQLSTALFGENYHFKVLLENNGLGPAFIKNFDVRLDGENLNSGDPISEAINLIKTPNTKMKTFNFRKGYAIKEGQEKVILELSFIDLEPDLGYDLTSFIDDIVKRVTLEFNYEDGFGKRVRPVISSNSLG
jgi:hypothetical protein